MVRNRIEQDMREEGGEREMKKEERVDEVKQEQVEKERQERKRLERVIWEEKGKGGKRQKTKQRQRKRARDGIGKLSSTTPSDSFDVYPSRSAG